jgi:Flp pilus assembly protein TadG
MFHELEREVFVFLAVVLVVLLGCAALVVDVGRAYLAKRHLQASADAAATAGALELPDPIAAESYALNYSGKDGAKNDNNKLPGVATSVTTKCLSFAPCSPVNTVVVEQTTVVPTILAKVLGIDEFTIKAKATACSPCSSKPLDIMLVLDRTGSMCQFSDGSNDPACTDLTNAKNGLLEFVQYMDPAIHKIGFAVFPPRTSGGSACSTPASSNYNWTSSVYTVGPLSNNYKVGNDLNESSQLVSTIRCQRGGGSTAYAHALERAQSELNSSRGRPGVQNVIVFFSDGAANTEPTYLSSTSPYRRQPCRQGGQLRRRHQGCRDAGLLDRLRPGRLGRRREHLPERRHGRPGVPGHHGVRRDSPDRDEQRHVLQPPEPGRPDAGLHADRIGDRRHPAHPRRHALDEDAGELFERGQPGDDLR